MKRVEVIEFEDLTWFPSWLRSCMTNNIVVIPLIPLFYAWDGQASMPRIYRLEDYDTLLEGLETKGYTWERGFGTSKRGGKLGSYVLGMPS